MLARLALIPVFILSACATTPNRSQVVNTPQPLAQARTEAQPAPPPFDLKAVLKNHLAWEGPCLKPSQNTNGYQVRGFKVSLLDSKNNTLHSVYVPKNPKDRYACRTYKAKVSRLVNQNAIERLNEDGFKGAIRVTAVGRMNWESDPNLMDLSKIPSQLSKLTP